MDANILAADHQRFPELPLEGRYRRAYTWLPSQLRCLLDGGCAWGYGTRFLGQKATQVYGVDPTPDYMVVAQARYPEMQWQQTGLESLPFPAEFFDAIVCCDTLEHVQDEVQSLQELWRVLQPGGTLIVTVPHRGLFAFMDLENAIPYQNYWVRRYMGPIFRLISRLRKGQWPSHVIWQKPSRDRASIHRHYSRQELLKLLDQAGLAQQYRVASTFRSGLLLGVLCHNVEFYLALFFPRGWFKRLCDRTLIPLLQTLAEWDYWIPYNRLAYNIALKIQKLPESRRSEISPR